jgi:DNA-binding HxlR family transcriptional regulator
MGKREELMDSTCPVARALSVLGDAWTLMILRDAFDGSSRFGEFQRNLGIARNILADRLHGLVEQEILELVPASDGSAYEEYRLTARGLSLFPVLVSLRQWGEEHLFARGERHSVLIEHASGKPLQRMLPLARDGHVVRPGETWIKKVEA